MQHAAVRTIKTGLGLWALALGEAALRSGSASAHHTAIDPWPNWCDYAGLDLVQRSVLSPRFRHIGQTSPLVLPALVNAGERFDFALIDGGHQFDVALMD